MAVIDKLGMQFASAGANSKSASGMLASGELNLDTTARGRMLATDVSRVRTSMQVKNSVLSSVNLVRANLAQALAAAKTIQAHQQEKLDVVAQQLANINAGRVVDAALIAKYDTLVDDQYHAALDLKTQDGNRLVGADAAGRDKNIILDGETKAYKLQQFRIDILTANTSAVRDQIAAISAAAAGAIGGIAKDIEVWAPGTAVGAGGVLGLNLHANITVVAVNGILNRQLDAYDGVAALATGGGAIAAVNNVLTINDEDQATLALKADQEIKADIDAKIAKLSSEIASMETVSGNYEDAVSDLASLGAELVKVNLLDLNKEVAEAQRQILIAAQLSARAQRNQDEATRAVIGG